MDLSRINPLELQRRLAPALDLLVLRRITQGHSLDVAQITADRDLLEQRVLQVLSETDANQMPPGWSWAKAAEQLAILVTTAMLEEEDARQ